MAMDDVGGRLAARLSAFERGDPTDVLDEQALTDASAMLQEAAGSAEGVSVSVMRAIATLHWYRYLALPDGHDQEDLRMAVNLFALIAPVARSAVPKEVLRLLERDSGGREEKS